MRNFSRCVPLGVIALTLAALAPIHAQTPQAPIVREIAIEFVGPEAITRDRVLANLATKVGEPYSQFAIEQDIRALYATGVVSNVRIFGEPATDGVKVTVLLQGKPSIQEILIEGTGQIPMNRVRKEIGSKVGDPLSEEKLEDDRQKILKLYEDRNYTDVDVQYVVKEVPNTALVQVTYAINEGPKMIVKKISFTGNDSVLPGDILKVMKTKKQDLLTIFNKSGRLLPGNEEEDKAAVRSLYQNRGFADAQVLSYDVQPLQGTGVELVIAVEEGIQYRVNSVSFEGTAVTTPDDLKARLTMADGSLYTPSGMTKDLKTLRDYYGVRGYVDMMPLPEVLPAGPGAVDITYRIDEGAQSYVNLINIQGNTRTKDSVIRRELAVKPGEIFDTTRVDLSKDRLNNLNYFSKVDTIPTDTLIPGRKDLNVIVEEKRTGSFNFGAGFSTIDSLVGFAELQQTNFDLFNWPRFVGGGQRFRVRGQYGLERQDFVVSFTEPWFLGQKLSFGVEGFYRSAAFLSTVYDQSNYGVAFQLRKPLWTFLSARAEYRLEGIRIFDVDFDNTPTGGVIQEAEGTYTKSQILAELTWDSRDSLFLTRRGELIEFTPFISGGGLGGDVQDYGVSLTTSKWISLPWDMILNFRGQLAVVDGWGDKDGAEVPLFDRLYLGGANNLRGFDFREVGPKDSDGNPIGGNSLAYATVELTFPIVSRVRGAFFGDWGYVNADSYDFGWENLNADIGIGVRVELPIGPIRIDYGFPVKTDQYNGGSGKVNFNIGYQF